MKIVVLTGAGISAESGLKTFRDGDGLWENYPVEQVASIEGWYANPKIMLQFYNERRRQIEKAQPNKGHLLLAQLEQQHDVRIVTQNIDNLHERAGSTHVLHLHGVVTKAQSDRDPGLISDIGYNDIHWGDKASDGAQLRPHIVWFGEAVPNIERAVHLVQQADLLLIIGTSMVVYPAAGLVNYAPHGIPIYYIDPHPSTMQRPNLHIIQEKAGTGMDLFLQAIS